MGRLSAVSRVPAAVMLGLAACALLAGCENDAERRTSAPAERSQAVQGAATPTPSPPPVAASAPTKPASSRPPRALCGGRLDPEGRPAPKKSLSRRAAAGVPEPGEFTLRGGYTWVNFWAAWCVPCREEIPRLLAWQKQLSGGKKNFRVAFVSLDDDERQLEKFLGEQPAGGLRATYWLKEGREREDWLSGAGVDPDPELPVHLLVDEKGKVRCRVQGAVEDADFASLVRLLEG
jgi:thiol-disulfide isomerase/thioredoxin